MDCATCESLAGAYVDGELSPGEIAAFEAALENCADCRRRVEQAQALRRLLRDLPAETTPPLLQARIERELRRSARPSIPRLPWFAAVAASLVLAIGVGWFAAGFVDRGEREQQELVAAYVRIAASDHPVDVASSDRHTVKPWFAGRIDYAPPVYDLTGAGFPLEGGRVEVIEGRKVALLIYRHNQHRVSLVLWPAREGVTATIVAERQVDGFAMASWRHAGFEMRATADLSPADLAHFAAAIDRAIDLDR